MTFSTSNPDRDAKILAALAFTKRLGDPLDLAHVSAALARFPQFDLDQDELDGFLADQQRPLTARERADARAMPLERAGELPVPTLPNGLPVPQAAPERLDNFDASRGAETEQSHVDAADEAPGREITPAEARHLLEAEKHGLDQARERLLVAQHVLKELRGELHNARMAWARLDQPAVVSMQAQARQFISDSLAAARARKAGKLPPQPQNRPGKSYVDRVAFYGAGGDANDYARGRHQLGGSHRGAYPGRSGMGHVNFDPRRGPVAKPPGAQ